jgi:hypothetical protein
VAAGCSSRAITIEDAPLQYESEALLEDAAGARGTPSRRYSVGARGLPGPVAKSRPAWAVSSARAAQRVRPAQAETGSCSQRCERTGFVDRAYGATKLPPTCEQIIRSWSAVRLSPV